MSPRVKDAADQWMRMRVAQAKADAAEARLPNLPLGERPEVEADVQQAQEQADLEGDAFIDAVMELNRDERDALRQVLRGRRVR